jgi:hypothetical protein
LASACRSDEKFSPQIDHSFAATYQRFAPKLIPPVTKKDILEPLEHWDDYEKHFLVDFKEVLFVFLPLANCFSLGWRNVEPITANNS